MLTRENSFEGKRISVAGLGVAGFAAADALSQLGASVSVFDASETEQNIERAQVLDVLGVKTFLGWNKDLPLDIDLLVVSPGLTPRHPWINAALKSNIAVWGELELAWQLRPTHNAAPWLCITGTNGKTTATLMLASILQTSGLKVAAVGNIGESIVSAMMDPDPAQVLAVEVGAPQLPFVYSMAPTAAAVLNLAQDHLDFFDGYENYRDAKAKIYHNTQLACVYNVDDPVTEKMVEAAEVQPGARAIGFTLGAPSVSMLGVIDDVLVDRAFIENRKDYGQELASFSDIQPFAPHNVANALAAAALARSIGVEPQVVRDGLRSFQTAPHRISFVREINEIRFIDDSKATNTHAADASLSAYQSVVWIAGGLAKGQDFTELIKKHSGRFRAVVLLGQDRDLIRESIVKYSSDTPIFEVEENDQAAMALVVEKAFAAARPNDVVLLAPGCASWDMFKDYKHRGTAFADAVRKLT